MHRFTLAFVPILFLSFSSFAGITKFVRFEKAGEISYGILEGDRVVRITGSPFHSYEKTPQQYQMDEIRVLVPTQATKVFGVASNIPPATVENLDKPPYPQIFFKSVAGLIPHGGEITIPKDLQKTIYEAELVLIIGRRTKHVSVDEAPHHILGVTCGNDVSGGDWMDDFGLWRVKGADTFAPCGPFLVTGLDYSDLEMTLRVNGETRQKGNTSRLIHNPAEIVSFISQYVTLEPGDLIYTGTPPPMGTLQPGDIVEVEIEGVGVLKNEVVKEKS